MHEKNEFFFSRSYKGQILSAPQYSRTASP